MTDVVTKTAGEARAAMARAKLTTRTLAEKTGRSPMYWSRRLNGETALTVDDLAAVADATGTTVSALLAGAA